MIARIKASSLESGDLYRGRDNLTLLVHSVRDVPELHDNMILISAQDIDGRTHRETYGKSDEVDLLRSTIGTYDKRVMRRKDRVDWIVDYVRDNGPVDVLNRAFVREYLAVTGVSYEVQPYGADKCPQLGADLSFLYRDGRLQRSVVGLHKMESGFPKWIWVYELGY